MMFHNGDERTEGATLLVHYMPQGHYCFAAPVQAVCLPVLLRLYCQCWLWGCPQLHGMDCCNRQPPTINHAPPNPCSTVGKELVCISSGGPLCCSWVVLHLSTCCAMLLIRLRLAIQDCWYGAQAQRLAHGGLQGMNGASLRAESLPQSVHMPA